MIMPILMFFSYYKQLCCPNYSKVFSVTQSFKFHTGCGLSFGRELRHFEFLFFTLIRICPYSLIFSISYVKLMIVINEIMNFIKDMVVSLFLRLFGP